MPCPLSTCGVKTRDIPGRDPSEVISCVSRPLLVRISCHRRPVQSASEKYKPRRSTGHWLQAYRPSELQFLLRPRLTSASGVTSTGSEWRHADTALQPTPRATDALLEVCGAGEFLVAAFCFRSTQRNASNKPNRSRSRKRRNDQSARIRARCLFLRCVGCVRCVRYRNQP